MRTSNMISVLWLVFITGVSGHSIESGKRGQHKNHPEKRDRVNEEITNEISTNPGRKHHNRANGGTSKKVKITKKSKKDCCNGNGICYLGNFCHCDHRYYGRYCEYYLEHEFCGPEIEHGTWHPTGCFMCFCFNGEMDCMRQKRFDTCTMEEPFPVFPWEQNSVQDTDTVTHANKKTHHHIKKTNHHNKKTHHHNKETTEYNTGTQHRTHHALFITLSLMVIQLLYIF
ncbi:unnamed protein product [Owenia fusiformis]|uniref:Uncharacterized protein n=1 Tax=Owenia fusiformis TaxID=6347 RepID=A0A8J1UA50_OWEFU|nr:unnamed protein product [Owenia fusiformis]